MARARATCGSESAYRAHLARGEVTCRACCDAHAVYVANWRARARVTSPDEPLRYQAARLGNEPAEALTTSDRHRLVADLHRLGWTDEQIATHTRMATYTAARIRNHLDLPAVPGRATRRAA